tara:strand:+ start:3668 stop:3958 length:291 start_codon:yes stop_codon:yes gene_type:complete
MAKRVDMSDWVWPYKFEPYLRPDKCSTRSGETRKLRKLVMTAKEQGFVIQADLVSFEEHTSGTYHVHDTKLDKRLTPKFKTVTECIDILPDFMGAR